MNAYNRSSKTSSRRKFFQQTGRIAAAPGRHLSSRAYAGEQNTIKLALVGCGGRGTGAAAKALSTQGPQSSWPWPTSSTTACSPACGPERPIPQAGRRAQGAAVHRPGRLQEGDRRGVAGRRRALGHAALPSGPSTSNTRWPKAATSSWRSRSPSTPRAFAASSRPAKRPEEEPQDRRRPDEPPLQAAGRGGRPMHDGRSARSSRSGPTACTARWASAPSRPA